MINLHVCIYTTVHRTWIVDLVFVHNITSLPEDWVMVVSSTCSRSKWHNSRYVVSYIKLKRTYLIVFQHDLQPIRWTWNTLLNARPLLSLAAVSRSNGRVVREASSRVPDADINGIKVEKVDRCVVLRMERGENRLNGEFYSSMHKALDVVER